jgi:hypothetical protein
MPQRDKLSDISDRLQLQPPVPRPVAQSLRSRGVHIVAPPVAPEGTVRPRTVAKVEIPGVVLAIGLYEFARAIALSIVGLMVRDPYTQIHSDAFRTMFFVLSNGAVRVSPFLIVTIGYALAEGICLWMRVNWGRRVLIATSFWAGLRLAAFLLGYAAIASRGSDAQIAQITPVRDAALMLAALNVVIGLYLSFAPGVAEHFGQQK